MKRIPTLDGWRAVAILSVIAHHAAMGFYTIETDYYGRSLAIYGAFGVDIFFALSGLLITKLLLDESNETGRIGLRGFYIRRAFRILPPYFLFLAGITIAGLWRSRAEIVGCLLFFRNYVPDSLVGGSTQHLWSLAVEEHFYLLWPGLLVLCGIRRAKSVAAFLAIAVGTWRMIESQFPVQWLDVRPHFRTDLRLDALLWGCAVAFLLHDQRERLNFTRQFRGWIWAAAALVAVGCIAFYSPLTSVVLAVVLPILLAGTVVHPEWWISRVLDWKPLAWIGSISYSLYLWNQVMLAPGWEHPQHFWLRWPWNLIGSFALAAASYYVIEKPLQRIGRRIAGRLRGEAPHAVDREPSANPQAA